MNMGEVKSPAPASAIGIMGITPKYKSIATTLKKARVKTAFQLFGRILAPLNRAKTRTTQMAQIEREK